MPFRPRSRHAVTPQHEGRFPGFDVLEQVPNWDDVTAGVVLARLALPNMLSYSPRTRSVSLNRCAAGMCLNWSNFRLSCPTVVLLA